ncbi:hypothetical protein K469DRAFT_699266 [Zopfia rhizophila CBS 207.26]|uniref:Transposase Tc1-like domain-containing protein n=1 Tax=Zopfia rhizophila CBS 207.26 TaxID=1314779 RepID=A0A6A6EWM6_9PEZI|nr:hypothetical protein K469DRAFT_699266 [Zopfia rhizophila CBS 207.26]
MGRRLPDGTVNVIQAYLEADRPVSEIMEVTNAGRSTIYKIRLNLEVFGTPYPPNTVKRGRPCTVLRIHKLRLLDYLENRPTAYLDEMQDFLLNEFNLITSIYTIYRMLEWNGWSQKATQRRAAERSESLRSAWIGRLVI